MSRHPIFSPLSRFLTKSARVDLTNSECTLYFTNFHSTRATLSTSRYFRALSTAMAPSQPEAQSTSVPSLPVKHRELVPYIAAYAKTSISELLQPFNQHEAKLRELFAQEPEHPTLSDPHVNTIPVFDGHETEITVRARDLGAESPEEKERYLMPLKDEERKSTGAPAVVQSFKDFQTNFNLFSESSLVDLNWSNVIAAGSSVVTSLLPVPEKYGGSKKTLRQYYHEILAPASGKNVNICGGANANQIQTSTCSCMGLLRTRPLRRSSRLRKVSRIPFFTRQQPSGRRMPSRSPANTPPGMCRSSSASISLSQRS